MSSSYAPVNTVASPTGTPPLPGLPGPTVVFGHSGISWRDLAPDKPDPAELVCALWRQAVHDLRGKLGVVTNVTALLQTTCGHTDRPELMAVLARNVAGLDELLTGLADLARLDAQQPRPVIRAIDAAAALDKTCGDLQVLARSRGLQLEFRGPARLIVEGDLLLLARIAQNLLLNALQYTRAGGVVLSCGPCGAAEAGHWYFAVGDAPIERFQTARGPAPGASIAGEGIGLAIVDRLCRLLDASMAVDESASSGRSTRIQLPRRYASTLEGASPQPAPSLAVTH